MREILFRGKRTDNGEWVYGYVDTAFTIDENRKVKSRYFTAVDCLGWSSQVIVSDETIGQYTGLTDKNGVKIFEGDIVRAVTQSTKIYIEAVTFKNGAFWYKNWSWFKFQFKFENVEVIGNIYDNPELLEGL